MEKEHTANISSFFFKTTFDLIFTLFQEVFFCMVLLSREIMDLEAQNHNAKYCLSSQKPIYFLFQFESN